MANEKAVVVGAGGIFGAWQGPLKKEDVNVVGIVDLNLEAARSRAEKGEFDCMMSTDMKDIIEKTNPDFVIDLTVPEAHCQVTCTALEMGCHVVGEKPMAASMAEAKRMVETSEKTGKMYMVSQSRRWNPQHIATANAVQNSDRGQLTTANCDFYIAARFGGFRQEMESPLLLDMSIHHFDLVRMMTGKDPVAVYTHEFNPIDSRYKHNVAATCIFEMTDGVVFTYRGSWCGEGFQTSWNGDWQFISETGGVKYEQDQQPVACKVREPEDGKGGLIWPRDEIEIPKVEIEAGGMHGGLCEMLAFLREGKVPQTECHDNIKSLQMVFGAIKSAREGRRITMEEL